MPAWLHSLQLTPEQKQFSRRSSKNMIRHGAPFGAMSTHMSQASPWQSSGYRTSGRRNTGEWGRFWLFAASAMRWYQVSESGRSEWPETEHPTARAHSSSEPNSEVPFFAYACGAGFAAIARKITPLGGRQSAIQSKRSKIWMRNGRAKGKLESYRFFSDGSSLPARSE